MDEETRELLVMMLQVIERSYVDVHTYWGVLGAEAPHLIALAEDRKRHPRHLATVHALFAEAYAAVESNSVSGVREALNKILGPRAEEKPI